MLDNVLDGLAHPRVARCQHTLQQRSLTVLAVILRAGKGEISKTTEVRIGRVKEIVETDGVAEITPTLPIALTKFRHPAVVAQLDGGHRNRLKIVNGIELRKTPPVVWKQALDPWHITGRQIGIGNNTLLTIRGPQLQTGDFGMITVAELHLLDRMAEVKLSSPLLDVIQNRACQPAVW